MTKAKTIDRLEFTRNRCPNLKAAKDTPHPPVQHKQGYSTCPNCGQVALIHSDGCNHCLSCGWSACS